MSKINVTQQRDIDTINRVTDNNLHLLCGKNNLAKINKYKDALLNNINSLVVLPYGQKGRWVSVREPGMCMSRSDGTCDIEMYSFRADRPDQDLYTVHEYAHELWHAIINYFNYLGTQGKEKYTFDVEGRPVIKIPFGGYIYEMDEYNHNQTRTIGKMTMETTVDILTSGSPIANMNYYRKNGTTLDTVFKERYDKWNDSSTGYSLFTSLTRLWIAAFANSAKVGYDATFQNGGSIFDCKVTLANGHTVLTNSYLHNLLHNPLAIEEEYDQIMGRGKYERLMVKMDKIFTEYVRTRVFPDEMKKVVKLFMTEVSNFANARTSYLQSIGILTEQEVRALRSSYNKIWNTLQSEYNTFFTQEDINDIARKAQVYKNKFACAANKCVANDSFVKKMI